MAGIDMLEAGQNTFGRSFKISLPATKYLMDQPKYLKKTIFTFYKATLLLFIV